MTGQFSGKVALVTGASKGIGLAAARQFAEAGASVVMSARGAAALDREVDALRADGHSVTGVTCDVSDRDQVDAMLSRTIEEFGRLDVAYNNAGVMSRNAVLLDTPDEEFDRVIGINLRGTWNCMKAELAVMSTQDSGGSIVNCSSIGGVVGTHGLAAYAASKFAVIGLTKSAALEYIGQGVRINAVVPGMIETPMAIGVTDNHNPDVVKAMVATEPIGRFGEADEVAAAVLWLCSPASSFVVGTALEVDGGFLAR